ncbi:MAG: zinc-ribbon domain-containing protein [Rhodobacteraceae bacterium]|nr:zinc-ribbon domain-containing protein [Paracoccaceae bacterium]
MRLICPNCGAQYEVDARVIPDTGRDVQCSNCGHTWFQTPAHMDNELADELGYEVPHEDDALDESADAAPEVPEFETAPDRLAEAEERATDIEDAVSALTQAEDEPEDLPQTEPEPEEAPEPIGTSIETESFETNEIEEVEEPVEPPFEEEDENEPEVAAQPGSALKDSVRDILRAEVEFDQSMRHSEGETLETQPDLGLEEPAQDAAKKSLRDRMARLRGLDPSDPGIIAGGVAAASGKRRDLLPDIEEINSTLSAASERDEDGTVPDEDTRRTRAERSGFRSVFLALVLTAVVLVVLYLLAPMIASKVPALAGVMESYIILANGFRGWLDQLLAGASARLTALLGQISGT